MNKHLSQKHTGFTLAEVLVTLMIIGIVASLTIPNIVKSTNNMQYYAGFMAAYKIVTNATNLLISDNDGDLSGVYSSYDDFLDGLASKLSVVQVCHGTHSPQPCWHEANVVKTLTNTLNYVEDANVNAFVLKNGMLIGFKDYDLTCTNTSFLYNGQGAHCVKLIVDINGKKGPNQAGRDVFYFQIYKHGIAVGGAKNTGYTTGNSGGIEYPPETAWCDLTDVGCNRNGISCGARLIMEGKMNY